MFPSLSPTERMYSLLLLYDFLPLHAIKSLLLGFQGTVMKERFLFKQSILTHICREKRYFFVFENVWLHQTRHNQMQKILIFIVVIIYH